MRNVFNDPDMETTFTTDGYCIVDLLKSNEIENLKNQVLSYGYGSQNQEKMRKSITSENSERKRYFFEAIRPLVKASVDKYLDDYRIILITIFDKLPGGGIIKLHNHPCIVDENKYRSVTIWIPLSDTSEKMGTLNVITCSHKLFTDLRTSKDYGRFDNVSDRVKRKYCTPLTLSAGQAVIFDDRLIHFSPPNRTSKIRTAIRLQLIPSEADLEILSRINQQEVMRYTFDERFYMDVLVAAVDPEKLRLIESIKEVGKIPHPVFHYDNKNFTEILESSMAVAKRKKRGLFSQLFG